MSDATQTRHGAPGRFPAQPQAAQDEHEGHLPAAGATAGTDTAPFADVDASFCFDESSHTYWLGHRRIPSVTQVIKPLYGDYYAQLDPAVVANAARRGTAVHHLTDAADRGQGLLMPDAEYAGYLAAWALFRQEHVSHVVASETRLCDTVTGFAGTVDRIVTGARIGLCVLEIKCTSALMPQTAVQLAGYARLYCASVRADSGAIVVPGRAAVQLKRDGTYRFERYNDPEDARTFGACLWLAKHEHREGATAEAAMRNVEAWRARHAC